MMENQEMKMKIKVNFKPKGDKVLVLPDPKETKVGNIELNARAQKQVRTGTVVAVGDGIDNIPMTTEIGERVYYPDFITTFIEIDDVEYLIMRERDLQGNLIWEKETDEESINMKKLKK